MAESVGTTQAICAALACSGGGRSAPVRRRERAPRRPGRRPDASTAATAIARHHSGACSHHGGVGSLARLQASAAAARRVGGTPSGRTVCSTPARGRSGCRLGPRPDRRCSPGAYLAASRRASSARRRSARARSATSESERSTPSSSSTAGPRLYGSTLEIDHIVSLELGGSNDIAKLFPERADADPGYRVKDRLENRLHALVCAGRHEPPQRAARHRRRLGAALPEGLRRGSGRLKASRDAGSLLEPEHGPCAQSCDSVSDDERRAPPGPPRSSRHLPVPPDRRPVPGLATDWPSRAAVAGKAHPSIADTPAMQQRNGTILFSPSDLNAFLECEHLTQLELAVARHELERPADENPQADLVKRKGDEHEAAYLAAPARRRAATSSRSRTTGISTSPRARPRRRCAPEPT